MIVIEMRVMMRNIYVLHWMGIFVLAMVGCTVVLNHHLGKLDWLTSDLK